MRFDLIIFAGNPWVGFSRSQLFGKPICDRYRDLRLIVRGSSIQKLRSLVCGIWVSSWCWAYLLF